MDDDLIRAAWKAWGRDFDLETPAFQAAWRKEIDEQSSQESFAYGLNMLHRAEQIIGTERFQEALKIPGTMIALSQVQSTLYDQFQKSYGIPTHEVARHKEGGMEFLAGIHQVVTACTAVGFLLRDAMDATDDIERMYNSEQEPEQ